LSLMLMKISRVLPLLAASMLSLGCRPTAQDRAAVPAKRESSSVAVGAMPNRGVAAPANAKAERTFSSLDRPDPKVDAELFPPGMIKFEAAELAHVLRIYEDLSHRTVIRSSVLPEAKITLQNQTSLNVREVLQALDTVLAQNGITIIPL